MKKILIILGSIVVIGGLLWFGLAYWIGGSIGGGGMQQYAPDTVQAGEPADITIIATATGGGGNIQGRFTNLTLHYRLVGENAYKSIESQLIALPDNFKTVQSKTFQSEAYKFTIPAYPKSTTGEIEYYVEMTFDGYPSKTDGVKKIKLGTNISQPTPVSAVMKQEINPDDFLEVTLDSRFEYYVKSEGKITFLSDRSSEVTIVILPGTSRYEAQTLPINPKNNMVYGNYGDYSYSFNAPLIPGVYNGVIVTRTNDKDGKRPEPKNFKLTVINAVKNEAEAYTVAEYFLRNKISAPEHVNVKGWIEQERDIILNDEGWKVSLVFDYQSCGIDWDDSVCTAKVVKGHYMIDKSSGIVRETNL